jgi:hypothetical protein
LMHQKHGYTNHFMNDSGKYEPYTTDINNNNRIIN